MNSVQIDIRMPIEYEFSFYVSLLHFNMFFHVGPKTRKVLVLFLGQSSDTT